MATRPEPESYFESVPLQNRWKLDRPLDFNHSGIQIHLGSIAASMDQWEGRVADELKLTRGETATIKEKYPDDLVLQARAVLRKWQEKFGLEATYRNLIVTFLKADKGNYAEVVCEQLRDNYCHGPNTVESSPGSSDRNLVVHPDTTQAGFLCPCKKCTLHSYIVNGCPKRICQGTKLVPFIKVSELTEDDCVDLEAQLLYDTENIITKFATVLFDVEASLFYGDVSPKLFAEYVVSIPGFVGSSTVPVFKEYEDELSKAENVLDVFFTIGVYITFFNHEVLEHIVERFGTQTNQENLKQYKKDFEEFCKRSVFEVPPTLLRRPCTVTDVCRTLAVKLTNEISDGLSRRDPTLRHAIRAKRRIASVFKVSTASLFLCRFDRGYLDQGCVEMLFLVPMCVFNTIFKDMFTQQVIDELSSDGLAIVWERTQC